MGFSVNFYLDKKRIAQKDKGNIDLPIFLYLRWNKIYCIKTFTQRKVSEKEWDSKKQRVDPNKYKKGAPELNKFLNDIENEVTRLHQHNINEFKETSKEEILTVINKANNYNPIDDSDSFFSVIDNFISDSEKSKRVKPATIDVYKRTLSLLKDFSEKRKLKIEFKNITLDFYNDFMDYMVNDLKFSANHVGKNIRVLKNFLNEATERGINKNLSFKSKKFKAPSEETNSIYMSDSEIKGIYELDLKSNPRLEKVRDLFVAGCCLGCRFSDLQRIRPENIQIKEGLEFIGIKTIKTDQEVIIPLHPLVKEILSKYNGTLPNAISNQKMNKYIKEVGELAGMSENEIIYKTKGGVRTSTQHSKFELLSTHTARRSFATNLYLQGVPAYTIMKITGHKTEKAFTKYIKVTSLQHAIILQKHYEEHLQIEKH